MKFYFNDRLVIARVNQEMLDETHSLMEDTEGIVAYMRDIATVEVAVLLKEMEDKTIKASMRSKRYLNVSNICSSFGGGGHIRAAGCNFSSSLNEAEKLIIERISQEFGD